jgi:hypothetical protein
MTLTAYACLLPKEDFEQEPHAFGGNLLRMLKKQLTGSLAG